MSKATVYSPSITLPPQTSSPSPPNRIPSPIDPGPPIPQPPRIHPLKHRRTNIDILKRAPIARIHDRRLRGATGGGIVDGDGGTAEAVGVWVGRVVHHLDGEGDDGVGVGGGVAAGAEAWWGEEGGEWVGWEGWDEMSE